MNHCPVTADTNRHYAAMDKADAREAEIAQREADLLADDEMLSEACQMLDCLEVRGRRTYSADGITRVTPPIKTGAAAMAALRNKDDAELGRLVRAEVEKNIRERAEDEISQEGES